MNAVDIFFAFRTVTGVEILRHPVRLRHSYIVRQKAVDGKRKLARRNRLGLRITDTVPKRVHTGIRARTPFHRRPHAVQAFQRVLQHLAHRKRIFLHLEPVVARAGKAQRNADVHKIPPGRF